MKLNKKQQQAREKICIPLDNLETISEVEARIEELREVAGMFKIGKELFTRFGPRVVQLVQEYDREVFLDLKYHDIPNTVKGAAKAAADLDVAIFNVHALGSKEMMSASKDGVQKSDNPDIKVAAVTVLTSIDNKILNQELQIEGDLEDKVLHLAQLAETSGLDGIVCSAVDLQWIRGKLPDGFIYITPGITGPNSPKNTDQKRAMTAADAIKAGSSLLVVGRGITAGDSKSERVQAGVKILEYISEYI